MVERGDANPSDIDNALRFGAAHPIGPFQLIDLIGLDTLQFIVDGFHRRYPDDPRFAPSNMLDRLVNENKLGKKTGEGFYAYDK
uniref:3-hydroxyacyl-CoA dehydrogenase C-terminal domain-containing protein n=1 Tax=Acrobeloides nanus TaxID=290746 RepID=A0A914DK06_9BILA